jgi:DNA polymerase-3 subunit gamma/tau
MAAVGRGANRRIIARPGFGDAMHRRIQWMSYLVLARRYRPRSFDQLVGQEHVVQALTNALTQQRLHHAYLFTGTRGVGKTTVSRILAKSLNCTGVDGQGGITATPCGQCDACREIDGGRFNDYVELDAASNRGVEDISQLLDQAVYKPVAGRFKVYMIDEVHMLSTTAFNAMLKTLEEPPEYLKFILATTDPQKVPVTVLSRCLQFNLRPMQLHTIQAQLAHVLAAENLTVEPGALLELSRAARGSMRDALSLTDQAIAFGAGVLSDGMVRQMLGTVDARHGVDWLQALTAGDGAALIQAVDDLRLQGLSALGALEGFADMVQMIAVAQVAPNAIDAQHHPQIQIDAIQRFAAVLPADELQLFYSIALHGREDLGLAPDEYSGLTMVLLRMLAFRPEGKNLSLGGAKPGPKSAPTPTPQTTPVEPPQPPQMPNGHGHSDLGDAWQAAVQKLQTEGLIAALTRELAMQSQCLAVDEGQRVWRLRVDKETLRSAANIERLQTALATSLGWPSVEITLEPGAVEDSPALREAAAQKHRQREADDTIHNDVEVKALMQQFNTARIVPGSIKPI